ncbi:MAG: efflux RND transporter periplasmic adaptor subunit [Gemmatimonadaceae bacterium]
MSKLGISAIAALVLAGAGGFYYYRQSDAKEAPQFRYATVTKGDIVSSVSSTGTLSAVTTVQVGTQVSGQLAALYVDFNDHVKKGQLLARIDSTLANQTVQDAQANLERVNAQLAQAQADYTRNKKLFDVQMMAASEFSPFESNLAQAKASLKSAQVTLDKAKQNLAFTNIYAPIDGVIVQRLVDVGQTVAASLSAPQLFLIANSLSEMQILASVDESDIGIIKEGQTAKFTVQAFPDRTFEGKVKQVRLQSTTLNNVVNYTVVVAVSNTDGKLLPGMTATVAFQTAEAKDALLVANAALRYKGTEQMQAKVAAERKARAGGDTAKSKEVAATPDAATAAAAAGGGQRGGGGGGGGGGGFGGGFGGPGGPGGGLARGKAGARTSTSGEIWYIGADGQPALARVRTGISDGQRTAITSRDLKEGTKIIIGAAIAATTAPATNNPLQPQQQGRGRGGPGGF